MLAVQREAEAELGDVTARLDDEEYKPEETNSSSKVMPNLLKATAASGNADLISGSSKSHQLDALLAKVPTSPPNRVVATSR